MSDHPHHDHGHDTGRHDHEDHDGAEGRAHADEAHAVDSVRIRWVGHELRAEAEITSDADLSLADAHAITEEAHHRLLHDIRRLAQATIHTSPCGHDGRDHHQTTAHHFPRS